MAASKRLDSLLVTGESQMPNIGGQRIAGDIVNSLRASVSKAMDESRRQIDGAVNDLVTEIRAGAKQVVKAVQTEAMAVRAEFGDIIGNAEEIADEAIADAKQVVANAEQPAKPNGSA